MQRLAKWGNEVSSKAPWSDLTAVAFNSLSYCPLCENVANWLKNKQKTQHHILLISCVL